MLFNVLHVPQLSAVVVLVLLFLVTVTVTISRGDGFVALNAVPDLWWRIIEDMI